MLELIYQLSPYAPVAIFVASVLDIFFASGLFLYGAAMMSSVAMMHVTGMISIEMIILSAYSGTLTGNFLNYSVGRWFGETKLVTRKLQHPKVETVLRFLRTRGLFLFIFGCRFFAVTRPLYALVLGSLKIKFYRFFLYEMTVALTWIVFWLFILLQGEKIYFYFFG